MDTNFNLVKELLRKHDYRVAAIVTDNGCTISYPYKIQQPRFYDYEYCIFEDRVNDVCMPKYTMRPYILTEICQVCTCLHFDTRLIIFYIEKDQVNEGEFLTALPIKINAEETALEDHLTRLVSKAIIEDFLGSYKELTDIIGITEGFDIIKDNFLKGEFA